MALSRKTTQILLNMKRILLAALVLAAPLCQAGPIPPQDLTLRTTIQLHVDLGIAANSMFNPRFFDGYTYVNQLNVPAFGRYLQGSSTADLKLESVEHRMIAPFRGANRTRYILGGSSAATTVFSRYDFDGQNRMEAPVPDGQSTETFDWVDENTIIYCIYNPSANRKRLGLAKVDAEPFAVTPDTRWNAEGYITTSATGRIRNVRVGDVYSGYAYYGDGGQNTNPKFFAINLATGVETELGNAGTLTGSGSFGIWTVVERGGYLYVQTTDNGIQVYEMTSATSIGALHTTYTKEQLTTLTGYSAQFWGFDVTTEGNMIVGGTGLVCELAGPARLKAYVLEPNWDIAPLAYDWMTTNHMQRGLAYSPVSGNVLTVSRYPTNGSGHVYVINSTNGSFIGTLKTNGIKYDMNFPINMIGAADDGAIYACSLAVDSMTLPAEPMNNNGPFRIYRWANESADPVLVYEGDPSEGDATTANRRYGDNIDVRGAGANTQIICGTRQGKVLAVFTTTDGITFTHTKVQAPEITSTTSTSLNGIAWGAENTFYTKNDSTSAAQQFALQQFTLDLATATATLVRSNSEITAMGGIIDYSTKSDLLAILKTVTTSTAVGSQHELRLFKSTAAGMVQQDHPETSRLFPSDYANGNGVGAVVFGGGKVFALAANNGIVAYSIKEKLVKPEMFWTETGGWVVDAGTVWAAAFDGSGKTPIAVGLNRPIGIAVDDTKGLVYWAEDGISGQRASRIARAGMDGSDQKELFNGDLLGFTNAQMLELDPATGLLYWTTFTQGILQGKVDGTEYMVLGGWAGHYTALDLDLVNGHIYYADPMQKGILYRCELTGANHTELVRDLATADFVFNSIAVDAANGYIYYTDTGTHEVKRMSLTGANQTTLLQDAGLTPLGITLRPDGTLFWVGMGGRLGTAKVDGTTALNLKVVGTGGTPFGIAVVSQVPVADLEVTDISVANSTVTIKWQGGQGPFQLQRRADVTQGTWEDVGTPTSASEATDTVGPQSMFYRVKGN